MESHDELDLEIKTVIIEDAINEKDSQRDLEIKTADAGESEHHGLKYSQPDSSKIKTSR